MKLTATYSALLACVLLALSTQEASALPTNPRIGLVRLPLQRTLDTRSDGLHPQIRLQQRMNRGQRRLALMAGRPTPNDSDLREKMETRLNVVEARSHHRKHHKHHHKHHKHHHKHHHDQDDSGDDPSGDDTGDSGDGSGDDSGAGDLDPSGIEKTANATSPAAPDSLGVDIESDDIGYFSVIQIGTPPRDFRVTIDSGSADFWVEGDNCKADSGGSCASDHNSLSANSSSSFVDTKKHWSITYGSGDVAGTIVRDNIVLGGLALKDHTFGVANRESADFSSFSIPYDGLIGLALTSLSNQKTITPVEALAKQGLIKEAITSYKISRVQDDKHDGEITFGGMDPTKFDAASLISIPNVSKEGFWEGAMDAVTLNGADMGISGRTAIFDTGTTGILAPTKDADAIHKAIHGAKSDGQGGFTLPCTANATIALTFGGKSFAIDPRDLADGPVDEAKPNGDCVSGISADVGGDDTAAQWLLGDTFLKNVYLSTNVNQNAVSLANLA